MVHGLIEHVYVGESDGVQFTCKGSWVSCAACSSSVYDTTTIYIDWPPAASHLDNLSPNDFKVNCTLCLHDHMLVKSP